MIEGVSWTWWVGFHVVVIALLLVDALLPGTRGDSHRSQKVAWLWTGVLALFAAGFACWIAFEEGRVPALQFADTRREPKTANADWWKLPTGSLPITAWKGFEYGK